MGFQTNNKNTFVKRISPVFRRSQQQTGYLRAMSRPGIVKLKVRVSRTVVTTMQVKLPAGADGNLQSILRALSKLMDTPIESLQVRGVGTTDSVLTPQQLNSMEVIVA